MPPATKDPAATSWHFDRRIPLALILTIVLQTGAAIWWASSVNSFMDKSREEALAISSRVKAVEGANNDVNLKLVRFETLLEGVTERLREQNGLLTEIRDKVGPRENGP